MDSALSKTRNLVVAAVAWALPCMLTGCASLDLLGFTSSAPTLGTSLPSEADPYLTHGAAPVKAGESGEAMKPEESGTGGTDAKVTRRSTANVPPLAEPGQQEQLDLPPGEVVALGRPVTLPTVSNPNPVQPEDRLLASNDRNRAAASGPRSLDLLPNVEPKRPALDAAPKPEAVTAASVVKLARKRLDSTKTYQVKIRRQERVGSNLLPEEDVVLSVRRNPKAVRFEWLDGPSKGREVIYSATENNGLLHVHMANALVPRLSLSPDSPLIMKNSRHPVTEAGFDNIVANLETGLKNGKGDNKLVYAGVENPPEYGRPCHKITRTAAGGENWIVYLDQATNFPAMIVETAKNGDLLERYVFKDVKRDLPDLSLAAAFDVNQRWGSGGFLSRLARGGAGDSGNSAGTSTR